MCDKLTNTQIARPASILGRAHHQQTSCRSLHMPESGASGEGIVILQKRVSPKFPSGRRKSVPRSPSDSAAVKVHQSRIQMEHLSKTIKGLEGQLRKGHAPSERLETVPAAQLWEEVHRSWRQFEIRHRNHG